MVPSVRAKTMGTPLRVVIAQSSTKIVQRLVSEMRAGGYAPDYCQVDSREALTRALDEGGWELLLCDYRLGDFNALDALRMVRERGLDLPVIIVSDPLGEDTAVEALHAGAHDYILKSNLTRLNPAIERELNELAIHRQGEQAAAALRESEARFRQLTENIDEIFWLIDCRERRMIYLSPTFERVWDRPSDFLLDSLDNFLQTVHPEDYEWAEQTLQRRGWAGFNGTYRIQLPDGAVRWITTRSFPIRNAQGEVYRIAGLSSDITRRKGMEMEMEKMSRALEQTADAVLITNQQGVIEYVNQAFEDITGYRREEVIGKSPRLLKSGFQDEEFYRQVWNSLLNGIPFSDVFINRRKDGDLYYESKTITPVRNERGDITHFVSTGKDITRRLRAQERLHKIIHYDAVTGLASRILLMDRLNQAMLHARREGHQLGVFYLGMGLEELFGDKREQGVVELLLRQVAARIAESVDEKSTIASVGTGRFAVVAEIAGAEQGEAMARGLLAAFAEPLKAKGYSLYFTPNIGISLFPADGDSAEELLARAERAQAELHDAPQHGYRFYAPRHESERHHLSS